MRGKLFSANNVEFLPRQGSKKIPPYDMNYVYDVKYIGTFIASPDLFTTFRMWNHVTKANGRCQRGLALYNPIERTLERRIQQ